LSGKLLDHAIGDTIDHFIADGGRGKTFRGWRLEQVIKTEEITTFLRDIPGRSRDFAGGATGATGVGDALAGGAGGALTFGIGAGGGMVEVTGCAALATARFGASLGRRETTRLTRA
jgi:hypothetical protein